MIVDWLAESGVVPSLLETMKGDVSTRTYYRVHVSGDGSYVLAVYPRDLRDAQVRFRRAQELLRQAGVPVPRLVRDDPERGIAMLEDLGPSTLYDCRQGWSESPAELAAALRCCDTIASLDRERVAALGSPALDAELLREELRGVTELLLEPAGVCGDDWEDGLSELCERLGAPPLVPCHRDFMARNLVPDFHGGVSVLDFQDLRLGPASYDLASLLNDSFFAAPELEESILASRSPSATERRHYARAVVQRSLKAAGTFLRFAQRGDRRHLPLVAPTLGRAGRWLERLPELAAAFERLRERWREALSADAVC